MRKPMQVQQLSQLPIGVMPAKGLAELYAEADARMAERISEADKVKRHIRRDGVSGKFRRK